MSNKFDDLFAEVNNAFNGQYKDQLNELLGLSKSEIDSTSFEILEYGQIDRIRSYFVYTFVEEPCSKTFVTTQILDQKNSSELLANECDQDFANPQHIWTEYSTYDSFTYEQITHLEKVPDSVLVNGEFADGKSFEDYEVTDTMSRTVFTTLPDGTINREKF